jgi:HD-GYP domain-containing protein (c-di-GMP phosphodiesterase class II)
MAHPLEKMIQNVNVLALEAIPTRSFKISEPWQFRAFAKIEDLAQFMKNSLGRKNILLLDEKDFENSVSYFIQNNIQHHQYGTLVFSKDPDQFLKKHSLSSEVIDCIEVKSFSQKIENFLFKGLRFLNKSDTRNTKISQKTLEKLNEIFIELSSERNLNKLLVSILQYAIEMTNAESGALFMVDEKDGELYFKTRITNDRQKEFQIENISERVIENSFCGYVAYTGKLHNLKNIEDLKSHPIPQWNKSIDYAKNNQLQFSLTIPLKNNQNDVIAILQLVNKFGGSQDSIYFESEDESLMNSFATQAAICLDNVDLYGDVQKLFDGFVKASITAIEARDPSTGGHSERVAKLCIGLAKATSEVQTGIYRSVRFKEEELQELEYAALLHDFGKIGVREEVLVKAKKLYQNQLDAIAERIKICKAAVRISFLEKKLKKSFSESDLEKEYQEKLKSIEYYWQIILASNEPTVLKKEAIEALSKIRNEQLLLPDGSFINLLSEEEYQALSVTMGSLTDNERLEIESHVRHTYQFLKMIPWTRNFKNLAEIAYAHHEKLDGTGYPRKLVSHEIPLQSKMMTIADIFDALTAADRWYKDALPAERALDIIGREVSEGKIDPVLFDIFVEKKIYLVTDIKNLRKVGS